MDKSETYEKALSIIQTRRLKAIHENEMRIAEVNKNVPEINEYNKQLFSTSYEIFKAISDGENVGKKIEQIRRHNFDAQSLIKSTLRNYNYPENYLTEKFFCEDCKDTGYAEDGTYCHCVLDLVAKIAAEEMNKTSQLKLSNFDTFSLEYYTGDDYEVMKKILEIAKDFAKHFGENADNLLMLGKPGLGKTHLSLAIANEVIKKGYSVIYDSAVNIFHKIEMEQFGRDKTTDTLSVVNETDLLIIDDLGAEFETPFYNSLIYNIINTRLNMSKSTIISSNFEMKSLEVRYRGRITSRLFTMYNCMMFKGRDIRSQKQKQKQKYDVS